MQVLALSKVSESLCVKGTLTRDFISLPLIGEAKVLISQQVSTVDLSEVCQVDTAGLAFLLLLIEEANKTSRPLSFQHLPEDLIKLAELSAVDSFLSVA